MRLLALTLWMPVLVVVVGACSSFTEQPTVEVADASVTQPGDCPLKKIRLGAFATTIGKVNVHTVEGADAEGMNVVNGWAPDPDCTSGADIFDIGYCRKFWPTTKDIVALKGADSTLKPFYTAGCEDVRQNTGRNQYLCCGD